MACNLTAGAGTQAALVLLPAKMTSCAIVSRSVNSLIPFVKRSGFITRRVEYKFFAVQPMATGTAKESRNEDTEVKVEKQGRKDDGREKQSKNADTKQQAVSLRERQVPDARRQQSLSLLDSWDPFSLTTRSLGQMMQSIDRLISSAFAASPMSSLLDPSRLLTRLPWDVTEDDKNFHLRIDMPGFKKDEVKVRVEDKVLVVDAEKKVEEDKDEKEDKWAARSHARFHTRIALPDNVETDKVKAKLKNGVLEVTMPKVKGKEKKVIDVKLEEE